MSGHGGGGGGEMKHREMTPYRYHYQVRASLPGRYAVIPTHAQEMYFPEVFGRSDGNIFTISE